MKKTSVLITRAQDQADEMTQRLRAKNLTPILAPLLDIRVLAPTLPDGVQAVLVASANALPALPADLHATKLLAVGDATAARACQAGFGAVHSAGRDAEALLRLAAAMLRPADGPVLLASGRGQGAALAAGLRAAGFRVLRRAVYEAAPVGVFPQAAAQALREGTLLAATFLSAQTARAFLRLLPRALGPALAEIDALAIGAPVAAALQAQRWRRVRCATAPTLDALLDLL